MSLYSRFCHFVAVHRDAAENYDLLGSMDETIFRQDILIEAQLRALQEFRDKLASSTVIGLSLVEILNVLTAKTEILHAGLEEVISEGEEVHKPNGTTRKLLRVAHETMDRFNAPPAPEDACAVEEDSETRPA